VSIVNRLERLAELLEMGALTPEEFATEKQRLLGRSANADRSSDAVEVGSGSNIYDEIGPVAVRKTPISDLPDCHVDQPDTAPSTDESKSAADRGAVNTRDGRSSSKPKVEYRESGGQTHPHVIGGGAHERGGAGRNDGSQTSDHDDHQLADDQNTRFSDTPLTVNQKIARASLAILLIYTAWYCKDTNTASKEDALSAGEIKHRAYNSCYTQNVGEALYRVKMLPWGGSITYTNVSSDWADPGINFYSFDRATGTGKIVVSGRYPYLPTNGGYIEAHCGFKISRNEINTKEDVTIEGSVDFFRSKTTEGPAVAPKWN